MVKYFTSRAFVTDPKDVWDKETTIGLAEHAARLGSLVTYDRRGNVEFFDDFDDPVPGYDTACSSGAYIYRTTETSLTGNYSVKCITPSGSAGYVQLLFYHTNFHVGKIGSQFMFASEDSDYTITLTLLYYSGSKFYLPRIRWSQDTGTLECYSGGGYVSLSPTVKYNGSKHNWGAIKLVVDISELKYVRALFFGHEFDLSDYTIDEEGSATTAPHIISRMEFATTSTSSKTGYFDNYILTDNEP